MSYFGSFGVVCHDLDGNELWRHPLPVAQSMGKYGSGTSPILVGDTVVFSRDQHQFASLLALDLATGAKRWETPRIDSFGSFGSPAYWRNNDTDEIVLAGSMRLKGYDLQSGAERWVVEGVTGAVCTTPVTGDQMLYFGAWSNAAAENTVPPWEKFRETYDRNGDGIVQFDEIPEERRDYARGLDANRDGRYTREDWEIREVRHARAENSILAVKPGGTGDITESHVAWKFRKAIPYVPSPLLYEGRIYYIRDGGQLSSLDARTGEPFYAQEPIGTPGNYYASPVAADGRIYVASLSGRMSVIQAGGAKPEVLHRVDFGTRILATPALAGSRIYVRTATDLWALGE